MIRIMHLPKMARNLVALVLVALTALTARPVFASSHMDAPQITLDPAANTTDVYAFVAMQNGVEVLNTALAVYPFEEPGIGPNKYNFDPNVLYQIHVALGKDVAAGNATISYQFRFTTTFKNTATILQSYLGVINTVGDANQNLVQTYTVTKVDHRTGKSTVLGSGLPVPPNNEGIATPLYNQDNNGNNPAKLGVATAADLDPYTTQSISSLSNGYTSFCGQRDDGFYGDVLAVFDLLSVRSPGQDAQAGFNVHEMDLAIPFSELGGSAQVVGVYATTSRQKMSVLSEKTEPKLSGDFVQVARQGNPLFNEVLVALVDKDTYSRTSPSTDSTTFAKYALTPEPAALLNALVFNSTVAPETNRTDIAGIFIPDMIRVDLSTGPCRLAGAGANNSSNPDDPGFSNLSIFGGDTLVSKVQAGFGNGVVPGGWPNGRRFGDDVVSIALTALSSDLRTSPPIIHSVVSDNVDFNDVPYNHVFPYSATPNNGRNHTHAQ
jgi:hypothetical protein